jgi:hypothetical protein
MISVRIATIDGPIVVVVDRWHIGQGGALSLETMVPPREVWLSPHYWSEAEEVDHSLPAIPLPNMPAPRYKHHKAKRKSDEPMRKGQGQ